MAFSEVPTKIIERAEALTERKLSVAVDLTKIICSNKSITSPEEVFDIFFKAYQKIKDLTPPPLEKLSLKKILFGLFLLSLLILGIIFFYLTKLK